MNDHPKTPKAELAGGLQIRQPSADPPDDLDTTAPGREFVRDLTQRKETEEQSLAALKELKDLKSADQFSIKDVLQRMKRKKTDSVTAAKHFAVPK